MRKCSLSGFVAVALACCCNAAVITLPNASFESPHYADGSGLTSISQGLAFGWKWSGPANNSQFGISNPVDLYFPRTTGDGTNLLHGPADGYQYAVLGGSAQSVSSIQNPASLGSIQPFTRYTLDIAAINELRVTHGSGFGTLQISLLAGSNAAASASIDYGSFNLGAMRLLESSFTTGDSTDARVGLDLNMRVSYTADANVGSNGYFDNLVLTATPIPEPNIALPLIGLCLGVCVSRRG